MRLRVLATAVVATLLAGLSACSSGTQASTGAPSAAPSESASGAGAFPATISTKFGDVTVAAKPTTVVALGWGDAETALALGVQPVGASDWLGFGGEGVGPWAKGLYTKAPEIIGTMEPSYEKIAALKPDLILDVKSSGDQARYDRLKSIAPTIGVPTGADSYLTSQEQQVTMIATALGEKEKGAALLKEVQDAFTAAAAAHPGWKGKTMTAATKTADGWGAYIEGSERVTFMQNLGFVQNPKIAAMKPDATGFSVSLSPEKLDDIDADVVVAFPIFIKTDQLTGDAAWKAVPAVKSGHAVVIDGDLSQAYSLGTTIATKYAIENLVPKLESALK
ncbi:MAG: iron-siderophore ABC transporter substrate-binding protein [Micropruina sp.]|uniref:iron-siderophore ABC transporter substrate-binding protein n=1 Tax=Micropruina sp. TaxID=2737536 RepID=UPI0039E5F5BE